MSNLLLSILIPLLTGSVQVSQFEDQARRPVNVNVEHNGTLVTVTWDSAVEADYYVVYHLRFSLDRITVNCGNTMEPISEFPWSSCATVAKPLSPTVQGERFLHNAPKGRGAYWVAACREDVPNAPVCSEKAPASRLVYIAPPARPWLSVVTRTENSLTLEWSNRRTTRFELSRRRDGAGGFSAAASVENFDYDPDYEWDLTRHEHVDDGLAPAATYWYRLKACNTVGCSRFSATVGGITEAAGPANPPPTPTGFVGKEVKVRFSTNRARLSWNATPGATYYVVHQGGSSAEEVSAPQHSYSDYSPNTTLLGIGMVVTTYWIEACNKAGCSPPTKRVSVGG